MSDRTNTVELRVRYSETDQMRVVYHSNYLIWCEIGRTEYLRALGKRYRDLESNGSTLAVAEASVRYHAAARYDDLIRVETTLESVGSRTITFVYVISNAETGGRLASARTKLISIDSAGSVVTIPRNVRESLATGLAD